MSLTIFCLIVFRLSLDHQSPFPSRPTIHRTPSGRIVKQLFGSQSNQDNTESSNLKSMVKLSNSSPALYANSPKNKRSRSPTELLLPVSLNNNRDHSPIIKTPRARVLHSPAPDKMTSPRNIQRHGTYQNTLIESKGESSSSSESLSDNSNKNDSKDDHPGTPKLAKSAQEKLRKLKEERLRQSTDTVLIVKRKKKTRMSRSLDLDVMDFRDYDRNGETFSSRFKQTKQEKGMEKPLEENNKEKELRRIQRLKEREEEKMKEELRLWKANEKQRKFEDESMKKHELERAETLRKEKTKIKQLKKKEQDRLNDEHEVKISNRRPNKDIDPFTDSDLESHPERVHTDWTPSKDKNINAYSWSVEPDEIQKQVLEVQGAAVFETANHDDTENFMYDRETEASLVNEIRKKKKEFYSEKENTVDLNNNRCLENDEGKPHCLQYFFKLLGTFLKKTENI